MLENNNVFNRLKAQLLSLSDVGQVSLCSNLV